MLFRSTALVWPLIGGQPVAMFSGHSHFVTCVALTSAGDGLRAVTGSIDATAIVWDVAIWQRQVVLRGHGGVLRSAVFSADATKVCIPRTGRNLRF